jgi:hypothetical protein
LSFKVWLTPYSNASWLLILATITSISFALALRNRNDKYQFFKTIFITIKIILKQASVKTWLLIGLTFLMFLTVSLYENDITSNLIAPTDIKPKNFKQVIEAGSNWV